MYHTFVINLDRSKERLNQIARQLDGFGLSWERFPAVDGTALSDETCDRLLDPTGKAARYHRPLSKGELGCFLSHYRLWQKIADSDLKAAVILEDDAILSTEFPQVIQSLMGTQTAWEFVKLHGTKPGRREYEQLPGRRSLVMFSRVPMISVAQIITPACARKLIEKTPLALRPVDVEVRYEWITGVAIHSVFPPVADVMEDKIASTIGDNRKAQHRKGCYGLYLEAAYQLNRLRQNIKRHGIGAAFLLECGKVLRSR